MDRDRIYYSKAAEERVQREKTLMTLIFLALGLGIGTALALMFAPQSGKKTREELGHTVEDSVHTGREAVEPTIKRLEKEFGELRKKVDERIESLRH
jgi:gas vesicle protein